MPIEKLPKINEKLFRIWFKEKYGTDPEHVHFKSQRWGFSKFKKDELFSSLGKIKYGDEHKGGNFVSKIEKLWKEIVEKPKSTIQPILLTGFNGKATVKVELDNVILLKGLQDMASIEVGALVTTVDKIKLGTDGSSEDETQLNYVITGVGNEKTYSTQGGRSAPANTQTAKFTMTFLDTDGFTPPVTIREAGQRTAALNDYSRVVPPAILLNSGEAILTQINELHRNGT